MLSRVFKSPIFRHEPALRAIIFYKLIRAVLVLIIAAYLGFHGPGVHVHAFVHRFREHATSAWAISLANLVIRAMAPGHIRLVAIALFFDGALTFLEGWSLHKSYWWGPWLVILATSSLLPFEVIALAHHIALGRIAILVVNLAIVIYLLYRAVGHRRALRS